MAGRAVHFLYAFHAQLHPTSGTMIANAAAAIVMLHHAHADLRLVLRDTGANRNHHAAGLMAGNYRPFHFAQSKR